MRSFQICRALTRWDVLWEPVTEWMNFPWKVIFRVGWLPNILKRPCYGNTWQNPGSICSVSLPWRTQRPVEPSCEDAAVFLSQQWQQGYIRTELRLKSRLLNLDNSTSNSRNIYSMFSLDTPSVQSQGPPRSRRCSWIQTVASQTVLLTETDLQRLLGLKSCAIKRSARPEKTTSVLIKKLYSTCVVWQATKCSPGLLDPKQPQHFFTVTATVPSLFYYRYTLEELGQNCTKCFTLQTTRGQQC